MLQLKNKQDAIPCDSCPNYNRYSIGKAIDGKIIRYSCHDKCLRIKLWVKQIAKKNFGDCKNEVSMHKSK